MRSQFELQKDPTKALLNAWATDCVTLNDLIRVLDEANYLRESGLVRQVINLPPPATTIVPPSATVTQQSNMTTVQPTHALSGEHNFFVLKFCCLNFVTFASTSIFAKAGH